MTDSKQKGVAPGQSTVVSRDGMPFIDKKKIMREFVKRIGRDLPSTSVFLWMIYCVMSDDYGVCEMSQKKYKEMSGNCVPTMLSRRRDLVKAGLIEVHSKPGHYATIVLKDFTIEKKEVIEDDEQDD